MQPSWRNHLPSQAGSYDPGAATIAGPSDANAATENALCHLLRRILRNHNDTSLIRPENLHQIRFLRTGPYSAKIDHDDPARRNDVRWLVQDADPRWLSDVENMLDELRMTGADPGRSSPATRQSAAEPSAQELSRNAFQRSSFIGQQQRGPEPIDTLHVPAQHPAFLPSNVPQQVSYSSAGFSIRPASPIRRSELTGESGLTYYLDIYIDQELRDRLDFHEGHQFAAGANGSIRLARTDTGDVIALKEINDIRQARREFGNHLKLGEGEHFIKVRDFITDDGKAYLAMDLVIGTNTRNLINKTLNNASLTSAEKEQKINSAVDQDLHALYAIHRRGYQHNDIHLGNYLHEDLDDRTYIIDLERMTELDEDTLPGEYLGMGYELDKLHELACSHGLHLPELRQVIHLLNSGQASFRSPAFVSQVNT